MGGRVPGAPPLDPPMQIHEIQECFPVGEGGLCPGRSLSMRVSVRETHWRYIADTLADRGGGALGTRPSLDQFFFHFHAVFGQHLAKQ